MHDNRFYFYNTKCKLSLTFKNKQNYFLKNHLRPGMVILLLNIRSKSYFLNKERFCKIKIKYFKLKNSLVHIA